MIFSGSRVRKEIRQLYRNQSLPVLVGSNGSINVSRWNYSSSTFSGWGTYCAPFQNFNSVALYVRCFDPSDLITEVRVRVLTINHEGTVLADKTVNVTTEANKEQRVQVTFDSTVANASNSPLWIEFYSNGKTGIFSSASSPASPRARYSTSNSVVSLTNQEISGGSAQVIMYAEFYGEDTTKKILTISDKFVSDLVAKSAFSDLFDVKFDTKFVDGYIDTQGFISELSTFSGWGQFIGSPQNFDTVELNIRWWKATDPITLVRVIVTEGSHDGPVLFDNIQEVATPQLIAKNVRFFNGTVVKNENDSNLFLMFVTNGKIGINNVFPPAYGPVTKYSTNNSILGPNYLTPSAGIVIGFWYRVSKGGEVVSSIGPTKKFRELVGSSNVALIEASILLPPVLRMAVGQEYNIYFEDIVKSTCNYDSFNWNVVSSVGIQYSDRWTFTPSSAATGSITFELYKDQQFIESKVVSYDVKDSSNGSGQTRNILVIGDSITFANAPTAKLEALFASDPMNIVLIGTKGSGSNKHEGVSGKTYEWHYSHVDSPFVFSGSFNFATYLSTNSFSMGSGDGVVFNLGTNDMFNETPDSRESKAKAALDYCDLMIAGIRSVNAGIRIFICLTHASGSQDAFATNYFSGQTRRVYEENRRELVSKIIERYSASSASSIYIVPLNIDRINNYPTGSLQVNSENVATKTIQTNAVHPAVSGYNQIGQCIYHSIKNIG